MPRTPCCRLQPKAREWPSRTRRCSPNASANPKPKADRPYRPPCNATRACAVRAWRGSSAPRGARGGPITSPAPQLSPATSSSGRWAPSACSRDRTGFTTGGCDRRPETDERSSLLEGYVERSGALVLLLGIRRWRCRRRGGWRRVVAFVAPPGFLGKLGLGARRDEVVAIGQLRHNGAGNAGFGLGHQALQVRSTDREAFALGLQLGAVIQFVFGGIDERARGSAVSQTRTAGEPNAGNEQHHHSGGARPRPERTNKSDHAAFINGQSCGCVKQAQMSALRLCPDPSAGKISSERTILSPNRSDYDGSC